MMIIDLQQNNGGTTNARIRLFEISPKGRRPLEPRSRDIDPGFGIVAPPHCRLRRSVPQLPSASLSLPLAALGSGSLENPFLRLTAVEG